ncbi:MAG TPA: sigma-54 dependent transcriptional regulator [Thermoanaerobaculia bacterium]|nr:sigma-54 dependent transcriptional regulator [Thermoanaerobaculia bacterium]
MTDLNRILLVEDKLSLAQMLKEALEAEGLRVDMTHSGTEAIERLAVGKRYAAVLSDLRLPGASGIEVLKQVKASDPECAVIIMTAFGTVSDAVEAMKMGAYDFIQKPIDIDRLLLLVRRSAQHRLLRNENVILREQLQRKGAATDIVGESSALGVVRQAIVKVAPTDSTVLLQGESGTGKELFARSIVQQSRRRDKPFVAINCAAIPDTLIENELFGHEKGAYTGATSRKLGKFELADSGTIFLDEIGELGLGVQSKILRVLQERQFERVGGTVTLEVDLRIICATNKDLGVAVRERTFREDLYFRINVFPVEVPPLRARRSDIPLLTDHFLEELGREMNKGPIRIDDEARLALQHYDWPGNVRELENCLERAVILCEGNLIQPADLRLSPAVPARDLAETFDLSGTLDEAVTRAGSAVEIAMIRDALSSSGTREETAGRLGLTVRALLSKVREHGLRIEEEK